MRALCMLACKFPQIMQLQKHPHNHTTYIESICRSKTALITIWFAIYFRDAHAHCHINVSIKNVEIVHLINPTLALTAIVGASHRNYIYIYILCILTKLYETQFIYGAHNNCTHPSIQLRSLSVRNCCWLSYAKNSHGISKLCVGGKCVCVSFLLVNAWAIRVLNVEVFS